MPLPAGIGPFVLAFAVAALVPFAAPASVAALPPFVFGPQRAVSVGTLSNHQNPRFGVFADQGYVVVWTVGPKPGAVGNPAIHARFFAADGSPRSGEFLLVPHGGTGEVAEAVLVRPDDTFVVAFRRREGATGIQLYDHLFGRRYDRDGRLVGREFRLSTRGPFNREGVALAATASGGFVAVWTGQALNDPPTPPFTLHSDAVLRLFDASGRPLGPERPLARGNFDLDAVARGVVVQSDGTLVVLIERGGDGVASQLQHLSADATRLVGDGVYPLSDDEYERDPRLARGSDDTVVVAWTWFARDSTATPPTWHGPGPYLGPYAGVFARRFDRDLRPLGAPFQVNKYGPGEQELSSLCSRPNGGLVVAWTDGSARDGAFRGVYGRAFDAQGTPTSPDQRLGERRDGSEYQPELACRPGGDVLAAWPWNPGGSYVSQTIFARALTPP